MEAPPAKLRLCPYQQESPRPLQACFRDHWVNKVPPASSLAACLGQVICRKRQPRRLGAPSHQGKVNRQPWERRLEACLGPPHLHRRFLRRTTEYCLVQPMDRRPPRPPRPLVYSVEHLPNLKPYSGTHIHRHQTRQATQLPNLNIPYSGPHFHRPQICQATQLPARERVSHLTRNRLQLSSIGS